MHQLVFECKVSSALHSAVVTALMYSFRKWHSVVASGAPAALEYRAERAPRATNSGDEVSQLKDLAAEHEALQGRVAVAERAQVEMQEMASSLRHREARLAAREAALEAALAPPASPSPSPHKTGSRELAAFRTAREGLRREPTALQPSRAHAPKHNGLPRRAVSASASPKGSGSGGAGAGTEAAEAAARELQAATAAARDWQAAARFALANLQGRTPPPPPPLQTLAAATLVAAAEHAVAARGDEAAERAAQRRAAQQQLTALQAEVAAAAAARDEAQARAIEAESRLRASLGAAESGAAAAAAAGGDAAAPAEEKAAAVGRAASASAARLAADQARFWSPMSKAPSS